MSGSTEERKVAVPKYFKKTPEPPGSGKQSLGIVGIVIAVLSLFLAAAGEEGGMCLGVLGFLLGGFMAFSGLTGHSAAVSKYKREYEAAEPKPSDQQMDDWLTGDIETIKKQALKNLDLEPEQIMGDPDKPIMVVGPGSSPMIQIGEDKVIRFSVYDVLFVYLTDYHLAAYKCTIGMADGVPTDESTQEYHYTDVVSVSTQTDSSGLYAVMLDGEKKSIASHQKFALSVASGEQIQIVISLPQLDDIIKEGRLAPTGADKAIKIIRARLREKKGGTQE